VLPFFLDEVVNDSNLARRPLYPVATNSEILAAELREMKQRAGIGRWISYYNADRPHSTFAGRTPDEVYAMQENEEKLAA